MIFIGRLIGNLREEMPVEGIRKFRKDRTCYISRYDRVINLCISQIFLGFAKGELCLRPSDRMACDRIDHSSAQCVSVIDREVKDHEH